MTPVQHAAMIAVASLSPRELEVLVLMARGMSNDTIAQTLCVSTKTLETHVRTIYRKLNLLADERRTNRRIMAVLTFLAATDGHPAPPTFNLARLN
jgi:DNA-binding NarL/FixJ family response regulator